MSTRERLRDKVGGMLDTDLIRERQRAGWTLVAIDWERDATGERKGLVDVPFGLRVAADCKHLEEHPDESEVLRIVMQGVVNDRPLSRIADDLNQRGLCTRSGEAWNAASVFDLMPALVENGPRIFSDAQWPARRF